MCRREEKPTASEAARKPLRGQMEFGFMAERQDEAKGDEAGARKEVARAK